jgi:DNA-binding GntR family transcriptional regulator
MTEGPQYIKQNLSDIVVDYLKGKILTGEYREGDRINEVRVAEELNISRAPVREGIKELESHGLLKRVPRKGCFVTKMSLKDIKEIYDIRIALESSIIETLIKEKKLDKEDFEKLTAIVDEMMEIANSEEAIQNKTIKFNEKDMEFHQILWEKADSPRKMKILSDLHVQLQFAMFIDSRITGNLLSTVRSHYDIIKYLWEENIEKSKEVLKNHVEVYNVEKTDSDKALW